MAKVSLAEHMKEHLGPQDGDAENSGPFLTISRQFGCYGFSLGLLLLDILTEQAEDEATWKIYHKDILAKLATETDFAAEILEHQRRSKPSLLVDFFRSLKRERIPSGYEIRNDYHSRTGHRGPRHYHRPGRCRSDAGSAERPERPSGGARELVRQADRIPGRAQ